MTMAADTGHADAPPEPDAFLAAAERVDRAVAAIAALDEPARSAAGELQEALAAFNRLGLVEVVQVLRADPTGKELLYRLVDAPAVHALLSVHGILRPDPLTRARRVLEAVRPYLQSHGGDVELVDISEGVARVRLAGACNGCSMSAQTLRDEVAATMVGAVEGITGVEVVADEPSPALIPVTSVRRRDGGWIKALPLAEVTEGAVTPLELGELSLVVVRVDGRIAAYRNACAHQGLPLDRALLDGGEQPACLVCPWHGFRFDALSGDCLSAPGAHLESFPVRVDGGYLWVRP